MGNLRDGNKYGSSNMSSTEVMVEYEIPTLLQRYHYDLISGLVSGYT